MEKNAEEKRVIAKSAAKTDSDGHIHAGHRDRLRQQIMEKGISGMPDHLVLEYLLFYALPRVDTNPLAHRLIDRFGSLTGVFDADVSDLLRVPGVGKSTACFLKSLAMIHERYALAKIKGNDRFSIEELAAFMIDYFLNKTDEEVFVFCLDNSGALIGKESVYHGSINSTYVSPRALLETVCRCGAVSIILAHNHPSGSAEPSREDIDLTRRLMDAFIPFGITICAHLVVAKDKYTDVVPIIYKDIRTTPRYIAVRAPETSLNAPEPETPPEKAAKDVTDSAAIERLYRAYGVKRGH